MRIGDLSEPALGDRLKHGSVLLCSGPFVTALATPLKRLSRDIHFLYGGHEITDGGVAHFRVRVAPPRGVRRYLRPQLLFSSDGYVPFHPCPRRLALPLLEWGLNWCLSAHCTHHLILHAAAVERDGRALLLPGASGSGKSTLCAALVLSGWRLLNDELALIRLSDGKIQAVPRPVGLKDEGIEVVRNFASSAPLGAPSTDRVKGTIVHMRPPLDSVLRWRDCVAPAWIVFPAFDRSAGARLTPVSKSRAFMRMAEDSFNYGRLGERGFEVMARLMDCCACHELRYQSLPEALEVLSRS